MQAISRVIRRFCKHEEGVTAIEYGLIAALIGLVVIGGVTVLGSSLETKFTTIASSIGSAG